MSIELIPESSSTVTISLTIAGETASGVSLTSLTRTDTSASVVTTPAAMTLEGGAWKYSFTAPAVGLTYAYTYTITWLDGSTYSGAGTATQSGSSSGTTGGTKLITFTHRVGDSPADATSVKFADPTATFGMRRQSDGQAVIPSGTALTHAGLGVYTYTATGLVAGATYEYWIEWVYNGATQRVERTFVVSDAAITPQMMVDKLTAALAANPVGVVSINVDGQSVTYSRSQALDELAFWERRATRASGTRPRAMSIDLSRGF